MEFRAGYLPAGFSHAVTITSMPARGANVMAPALRRVHLPAFLTAICHLAACGPRFGVERWAFLFLASLFASPPYGTQRVDFAVLWGAGFTLNPGKWSFPSTAHISRSRCLIPSRGRSLLAFAPTIFSSPLPPAGALCLPSRACCKNLRCVARSLGTRRCNHCGFGWNVAIATL